MNKRPLDRKRVEPGETSATPLTQKNSRVVLGDGEDGESKELPWPSPDEGASERDGLPPVVRALVFSDESKKKTTERRVVHCGLCGGEGHNKRSCPNGGGTVLTRGAAVSGQASGAASGTNAAATERKGPSLDARLVWYDLETTGLARNSRILQLCAIVTDGKYVPIQRPVLDQYRELMGEGRKITVTEDSFVALVYTDAAIEADATKVHGITKADIANALPFRVIASLLNEFIVDRLEGKEGVLVGYNNGTYDDAVLLTNYFDFAVPLPAGLLFSIDVLQLVKKRIPDVSRLESIAQVLNSERSASQSKLSTYSLSVVYRAATNQFLRGAHDSLADTRAVKEVAMKYFPNGLADADFIRKASLLLPKMAKIAESTVSLYPSIICDGVSWHPIVPCKEEADMLKFEVSPSFDGSELGSWSDAARAAATDPTAAFRFFFDPIVELATKETAVYWHFRKNQNRTGIWGVFDPDGGMPAETNDVLLEADESFDESVGGDDESEDDSKVDPDFERVSILGFDEPLDVEDSGDDEESARSEDLGPFASRGECHNGGELVETIAICDSMTNAASSTSSLLEMHALRGQFSRMAVGAELEVKAPLPHSAAGLHSANDASEASSQRIRKFVAPNQEEIYEYISKSDG